MKNAIFLTFFAFFIVSTTNAQYAALVNNPSTTKAFKSEETVKWDKMEHDFGTITQNIPAQAEFVLSNTSDKPLIIKNVKGSCGCTAVHHDNVPVPPGESTTIMATYNAKNLGAFNKTVKVTTNHHDKPVVLKIKGSVVKEG